MTGTGETGVAPLEEIRVLIADDEKPLAELLGRELTRKGHRTAVVHESEAALARLAEESFDVLILDLRIPNMDGLEALAEIRAREIPVEVIMMTGHGSLDSAIEAMRRGAYDYVTKPAKLEELDILIRRAAERSRTVTENRSLRRLLATQSDEGTILAESSVMRDLLRRLEKVARAVDVPVLITGESGTGKELVAREIHRLSPMHEAPFVAVNCAALQEHLLESEIFGHEKGAFTGATTRKPGIVELARGGTLFLDEIAEIGDAIQAKLLRFIQFGEFRRVGGTEELRVETRIVAATNRDLETAIESGDFREDLYYRLDVARLHLPPLRERPEDVALLAERFLVRQREDDSIVWSKEALEAMRRYEWPGNVRELENFVRRLLIFHDAGAIPGEDVSRALDRAAPSGAAPPKSLRLADVERAHIERVITLCDGNKTRAARELGIATKTLYNRLNEWARADGDGGDTGTGTGTGSGTGTGTDEA